MTQPKQVRCPACNTLFGIEVGPALNIKSRDLYRRVTGRVEGPCRKCGQYVVWPLVPERLEKS